MIGDYPVKWTDPHVQALLGLLESIYRMEDIESIVSQAGLRDGRRRGQRTVGADVALGLRPRSGEPRRRRPARAGGRVPPGAAAAHRRTARTGGRPAPEHARSERPFRAGLRVAVVEELLGRRAGRGGHRRGPADVPRGRLPRRRPGTGAQRVSTVRPLPGRGLGHRIPGRSPPPPHQPPRPLQPRRRGSGRRDPSKRGSTSRRTSAGSLARSCRWRARSAASSGRSPTTGR